MKFKEIFALLLIPVLATAGGFTVEIANKVATTNTVTTPIQNAYIESFRVDVTGTSTGTLTITAADGEQVFSKVITADASFRPRAITHDSTGKTLGAGTNVYAKYLMATEKLTVTLAETAPVTNNYLIKVKTVPVKP